jgi:glycosyltransferase involved in cell wall biosynthesis
MMHLEDSPRVGPSDHLMSATLVSPLVSVAMPTFNRPEYLRRALEGVLAQTYPNLEILVGDNGNSPITREIVESFNDPRVTYIGREQNLGMALNVLSLFRQGSGKYFCVLADDDFWGDRFVEKLVAVLERNPSVGLAFSDYHVVDGRNELQPALTDEITHEQGRDRLEPGLHVPGFDEALIKRNVPLVASVFRRESVDLERFMLESANTYDLWLFYLALENGGGAYFENERLMYCRVHTGQDSVNSHVTLDLNASLCYEQFIKDSRLKPLHAIFREEIILRRTRAGTRMLHVGRVREARQQLLAALRRGFNVRTAIGLVLTFFPSKAASVFSSALRGVLVTVRRVAKVSADRPT